MNRFRLNFLAKFVLITAVLAVVMSFSMSSFLIERHRQGLRIEQSVTAAGQVSAVLTKPLADFAGAAPARGLAGVRVAASAALQIDNVAAVVVYGRDGRAIYPPSAPPRIAEVRKTLDTSNLWTSGDGGIAGASEVEYLPLFVDRGAYVVAIGLYDVGMNAQMRSESRDVIEATVASLSILFLSLCFLALGASREIERSRRQANRTFSQTLGVLAATIDRRDPYTAGHSRRVADYSRAVAERLALRDEEQNAIEHAALLHDIGKIGIPDAILLKPAGLDDAEFAVMREHPAIGAAILGGIDALEGVTLCVLHHHERIDGAGYPAGLAGDQIPLGARIIAVAEAFDAMTTDRPYRRALSITAATEELERSAGRQFDQRCAGALLELVAEGAIVPPAATAGAELSPSGQRNRLQSTLQGIT